MAIDKTTLGPLSMEEIYETYYSQIYNYIFYRVLHREITEDIVSDIFIKILLNLDRYDASKASISTWVFRIAEHTLIDYYRVRKVFVDIDGQMNTLSVNFDEQYEHITHSTNKELYLLLTKLTERQRTVIYLKYFGDMNNKEIAEVTGINSSTVGTLHQRALETLRKYASKELLDSFFK